MPKMSWNNFVTLYPGSHGFATRLATKVPLTHDKNGKKLPSPYLLLCRELKTIIKGPWTADKKGEACMFLVADAADLQRIDAAIGLGAHTPVPPSATNSTAQLLNFDNKDYGPLARKHGFNV